MNRAGGGNHFKACAVMEILSTAQILSITDANATMKGVTENAFN